MDIINYIQPHFSLVQLSLIILIFIWSGFVRSGLGFGGAALTLPGLLLIHEDPLFFLPIIGWHLLFFSILTLRSRLGNVNWAVLKRTISIMILPKIAGLIGLLSLPNDWLLIIVFSITFFYGLLWLLNHTIKSQSKFAEIALLSLGGYASGTSLNGAPLIVSIILRQVEKHQYRETLFVLWIIMVTLKMSAFAVAGVDLQVFWALGLIPLVAIGHYFGLKAHDMLLADDGGTSFKRFMGFALCLVSFLGLIHFF